MKSTLQLSRVLGLLLLTVSVIPSAWASTEQVKTAAEQLYKAVSKTRMEAMTRRTSVVLCSSSNGAACDRPGSQVMWRDFWTMLVPQYQTMDAIDFSAKDEVLLSSSLVHLDEVLIGYEYGSALVFNSRGRALAWQGGELSEPQTTPYFRICPKNLDASQALVVIVNPVGRPKITQTDPSGHAVSCRF